MERDRGYAWRMLGYLWALGFAAAISRFVIAYYQPAITEDLDVSRTFIGFTWSFNLALGAVCSPLGGWLTDRYGPRRVMVMNAGLGVLSMAAVLLMNNATGFFIGLGVLSGLTGIGASTGYVLVSAWFDRHRAKALMLMTSAGSLGLAVLTPVFVGSGDALTWMSACTITLWIGVVSIPLTLLMIRERKRGEPPAESARRRSDERPPSKRGLAPLIGLLRSRTAAFVGFALFTCGFSMGTVEMHLMAIHQHAEVGAVMFASSLSLLGLLELAGGMLFACMLDRYSRTLALSVLYLFRVLAFTGLFLHLPLSPVWFSVVFGASYLGAIPGGLLVATEALGDRHVGLQVGTLLIFHQIGGIAASLAGGLLYDLSGHYQWLIGLNLLFSAAAALGYYRLYVRNGARPRRPTAAASSTAD